MQRVLDFLFSVPSTPIDELNATDADGNTRLMLAAADGDVTVMTILLNSGAEIDKRGHNGFTALAVAAHTGQAEAVALLISRGARIETETDGDSIPFSYATLKGTRPLAWAALDGHVEVVKLLLAAHAKVNKRNGDLNTPLILAAANGHVQVVRLLLQAGAKKNKVGVHGFTAEAAAEHFGHDEVVKLLRAPVLSLRASVHVEVADDDLDVIPMEISPPSSPLLSMGSEREESSEGEDSPLRIERVEEEPVEEELPNRFLDPVTLEPMDSPIATKNGHTYNRATLVELIKHNPQGESVPCPLTREPIELEAATYASNIALKEEIQERIQEMARRKEARNAVVAEQPEEDVREKRVRYYEGQTLFAGQSVLNRSLTSPRLEGIARVRHE